ncbi:MAG: glycosyltransferase [Lachnospiraceae bacterium]|nr:glycosyltransferase [Lachnospiraceae bacterium]
MKIVQVNTVVGLGSVGRICVDLYDTLQKAGHEPYVATGRGKLDKRFQGYEIGNKWDFGCHVMKNFFQGKSGFGSAKVTEEFIAWLEQIKPNIIHLHNIHGFYLQTELLFDYLKKADIPVIWTLHDCWPFTGHCAYFDYIGCEKWCLGGCYDCKVHAKVYPYALFKDNTEKNYAAKKAAYTGVKNLTIVTPSRWLAELVKKSFLKEYPVEVIPNGINLGVFCPDDKKVESTTGAENAEPVREKEKTYTVLGVANRWEERKGLIYFEKLAETLPENYRIKLVGVDRRQAKKLRRKYKNGKIIPICRTANVGELVQLYREADVYVNATLEDNFPTTNLEALACGTPVITFSTGGSAESLSQACGVVVPKGDIQALIENVRMVCEKKPFTLQACRARALAFDRNARYKDYISLYREVAKKQALFAINGEL